MDCPFRRTITRRKLLSNTAGSLIGIGAAGLSAPLMVKRLHASADIEYRTLGKTGLKVTAVGMGCPRTNEPSMIKRAVDMGVNFLDTGRMYAGGRNEEMIGRVIKDIRKDIVIQSKIDQKIQNDRIAIEKSIDESLKALQTDYVDIMIIRGASTVEAVKNAEVMEAFGKAKKAGKIRFCGFSSHTAEAYEILKVGVQTKFYDVAMVPYNHAGNFHHTIYGIYSEWDQNALEREFENAVKSGMGILVMKTCSAGPLKKEGETRGTYQAGLKWILRNKNVSTMAVGMASFREVAEDIGAMG